MTIAEMFYLGITLWALLTTTVLVYIIIFCNVRRKNHEHTER